MEGEGTEQSLVNSSCWYTINLCKFVSVSGRRFRNYVILVFTGRHRQSLFTTYLTIYSQQTMCTIWRHVILQCVLFCFSEGTLKAKSRQGFERPQHRIGDGAMVLNSQ